MIHVALSVQRSFLFPADLAATAAYCRDFDRILKYLPRLHRVKAFAQDQYRILCSPNELGVFRLDFYRDLEAHYDDETRTLYANPLAGIPPAQAKATLTSITSQGSYSGKSVPIPSGKDTQVDYGVDIAATVPKQLEWKLMPDQIIERVAENRTRQHLSEMTDQFIARAIDEFRRSHVR